MCGTGSLSKNTEKGKSKFTEKHEDLLQDERREDSFDIEGGYEADDETEVNYERSEDDFSVVEGLNSRRIKASQQHVEVDKLVSGLQSGTEKEKNRPSGDTTGLHKENSDPGLAPLEYHVMLPGNPENDYESQFGKPNNCFACTAAAMMNQHFKKMKDRDGQKVNQDDVRAYIPKIRTWDDFKDQYKGNEKSAYDVEVDHINQYVGVGKTEMGNVFSLSDFFMQLDSNVAVNYMQLNLGEITDGQHQLIKKHVLDLIGKAITSGEAVGLLNNTKKHYTTIIGIDGSMIKYLDSNDGDPSEIHCISIDELLVKGDHDYELTWLSEDTRTDAELDRDYGDFFISEDTRQLKSNSQLPINDIAHTCGISATLSEEEKIRDGADVSIAGKVTRTIYIPRKEKITPLDLNAHRAKYKGDEPDTVTEEKKVIQSEAGRSDLESEEEEEEKRKTLKVQGDKKKSEDRKEDTKQEAEKKSDKHSDDDPLSQLRLNFGKIDQIQTLAAEFTGTADKDRSESFLQLKDALIKTGPMITAISQGNFTLTGAEYPDFLELYMALDRYVIEHRDAGSRDGKRRFNRAYDLKKHIDALTNSALEAVGLKEKEKIIPPSGAVPKSAKENLERFIDAYFEYNKRIGMDLVSSEEDKLVKKWNAIKTCETDILLCLQGKNEAQLSEKEKLILREYRSLRTQMVLRNATKKKTEQEEFGDEGLSRDQLEAISRIDTWVIRNIRNGGYFRAISDRTDIAGRLMSMTKRQRLYAYYLVETRERISPSLSGVSQSQLSYIPDVKIFKKQMIASKAKFYMRFSGSYIYWDKLTKAMGISQRATPILEEAREYLGVDRAKDKLTATKEEQGANATKTQKQIIRAMLLNARTAMEILEENEKLKKKKRPDQKQIDQNNQRLITLANEGHAIMSELATTQKDLMAGKAKKGEKMSAKDYREGFVNPTGDLSKVISSANHESWNSLVTGDPKLNDIFGISSSPPSTFAQIYTDGANGLAAIGGIIGIVLGIAKLSSEMDSISTIEYISQASSIASSMLSVGKSAAGIIKVSVSAGTVQSIAQMVTAPVAALGFTVVDTAVAVVKGASNGRDSRYRHSAASLAAKEKRKDDRYREGMLRLNEKLGSRQLTSTMSSVINAGVSATATALILASVVTGGIAAVGAVVALGVGIGARILDRKYSREMKFAIFDSYFRIDELVEAKKAEYRKRYPGRSLSKDQEERILTQIRGKVASDNGYYSPGHAAQAVALLYARYLIRGARGTGNHAEMCQAMIKGLGLDYRHDSKHPEYDIPTKSDIVKKICG